MLERLDNHRDFYDGERLGINPALRIEAGDSRFDLSYEYIDHQRFIDRGIPTGSNGRPVEAFQDIVFGDADVNTTELKAHLWRAAVQHTFSDTLKVICQRFMVTTTSSTRIFMRPLTVRTLVRTWLP